MSWASVGKLGEGIGSDSFIQIRSNHPYFDVPLGLAKVQAQIVHCITLLPIVGVSPRVRLQCDLEDVKDGGGWN